MRPAEKVKPGQAHFFMAALIKLVLSLFFTGFAAVCLVVLAPGFGTDEREIDPRLSAESIQYLKRQGAIGSIPSAYWGVLQRAWSGDFGYSAMLNRPVGDLIAERYAATAAIAGAGWAAGWSLAFLSAALACVFPRFVFRETAMPIAGVLLCIPSALLAFGVAVIRAPACTAIAAIVFARIYPILSNLFRASQESCYVKAAKARGVAERHIFLSHILSATREQCIVLGGTSVAIAIGAALPVEVLTNNAGIGQLAWKAATARDLPLLVNLTLLIATVTMSINTGADLVAGYFRRSAA